MKTWREQIVTVDKLLEYCKANCTVYDEVRDCVYAMCYRLTDKLAEHMEWSAQKLTDLETLRDTIIADLSLTNDEIKELRMGNNPKNHVKRLWKKWNDERSGGIDEQIDDKLAEIETFLQSKGLSVPSERNKIKSRAEVRSNG